MKTNKFFSAFAIAVAGLATIAFAATDTPNSGSAEMQLPPGWTADDMQNMLAAATPGKMHQRLADDVGSWKCATSMWMAPDTEAMISEGTSKVTPLMEGRFVQMEMDGEMPGMGPYKGLGIYGYDNVSEQFVATWIDNHGTGIMNGTGQLSEDGKSIIWEFTGNCPITHKQITMREVDTVTGPNSRTLEMFGTPPKGGEEFKMMSIELTRE